MPIRFLTYETVSFLFYVSDNKKLRMTLNDIEGGNLNVHTQTNAHSRDKSFRRDSYQDYHRYEEMQIAKAEKILLAKLNTVYREKY